MSAGHRIVIVGAGQAGGRAAQALRDAGYLGRVTLLGDEAAPPYERPALSKAVLLGEAPPESTWLAPRETWRRRDVELLLSTRVDVLAPSARQVILSNGRRLGYDALLLATGSRVRPLASVTEPLAGLHTLRTLDDAARLGADLVAGRHLVVIGGGFIGLEVATAAVRRGLRVTVVERQASLLERALPPDIADTVAELHRSHGVEVILGCGVTAVCGPLRLCEVVLADGRVLAADLAVIGIGIIPNTELAEAAGAQSADGVVTDEFGRTTVEGIWAAGEVTSHWNPLLGRRVRLESWQNAQNQAIAVASNMARRAADAAAPLAAYAEVPWFWSDQYDVNIQIAGLMVPGAVTVWRGEPTRWHAIAFSLHGGRVVCATAFNMGGELRFARRLIESGARVAPEDLANPARRLKDLVVERAAA